MPQDQLDFLQSTNIFIIMNHIPITMGTVYSQLNLEIYLPGMSSLMDSFTNTYIMEEVTSMPNIFYGDHLQSIIEINNTKPNLTKNNK